MIDRATVDRIIDAANIVDVVSEFVTLKKSGANYKGLCPFHNERTPSFYVSPARNICKCFSCGQGGTPVGFLIAHEQMTYPEALRWLAKKYNIEIQERELSNEEKAAESKRESMFIVNEWAANYFEDLLHNNVDGIAIGMQYFRSRDIRDDIIRKFRLGYDLSDRYALPKEAQRKGYQSAYLWGGGDRGDRMKAFAKSRPDYMRKHLRKNLDVGDDVVLTLNTNDSKAGYIELNSLTLKKFEWSGSYFKNVPVKLRAVARPGYKFVRWEFSGGLPESTCAGLELTLDNNATINAVFEKDANAAFNSVVINEINYKSADDFDTKDWIELYNTTAATINLSGWKLLDGEADEAFIMPVGTTIEAYGYLVVCANQNKLLAFNPTVTNYVGDFTFGLSKEDKIQLFDSEGTLIDEVSYAKSWGDANGTGKTIALTDPFADNANYKLWSDSDMHGTPGAQNGTFKPSNDNFSTNEKVFVDITEAQAANASAVCYPNPVSSEAALVWQQTADANVRIELFNAFGNCVAQICNEWFAQGHQQIDISRAISNCSPGLYIARITIDGQSPLNVRIIKQ